MLASLDKLVKVAKYFLNISYLLILIKLRSLLTWFSEFYRITDNFINKVRQSCLLKSFLGALNLMTHGIFLPVFPY